MRRAMVLSVAVACASCNDSNLAAVRTVLNVMAEECDVVVEFTDDQRTRKVCLTVDTLKEIADRQEKGGSNGH